MSQVDPSIFAVFGATGDLAHRKIFPALYQLHKHHLIEGKNIILGVGRDQDTDDAKFRASMKESLKGPDADDLDAWLNSVMFYQGMGSSTPADFQALKTRLENLERDHNVPGNRAFYLSLPPTAFPSTIAGLGAAGLNKSAGWTRVVIEKPFGHDLDSAK